MKSFKPIGKWKQIKKRVIFKNQWICFRNDFVKRPDNKVVEYALVDQRDYSAALCITATNKILIVKQFRYPWMEYSFEIPSGLLEDGESPRDGASREIQEETGYRTKTLKYLMKYHDVGFANGWGYLFFGRVNKEGKQKLDANEFMEVKEIEISRFEEMIKNNKIIHSPTLLTWFIAKEQGLIPEL